MTISALPTPPSRADAPDAFSMRADALLGALPQFVSDANALAVELQGKLDDTETARDAAAGSASAAANSASLAQAQVGLAADQVTLATAQKTLAATSATAADASRLAAQTAAAAAADGAGLPSLAGSARKTLRVNSGETGVEWAVDLAVGDILSTSRTLSAPEFLPCDGSTYLKSSYAALAGVLGQIPRTDNRETYSLSSPLGTVRALAHDGDFSHLGVGASGAFITGSPLNYWWVSSGVGALTPCSQFYGAAGDGAGRIVIVGEGGYLGTYDRSTGLFTQQASPFGTAQVNCVTYGGGQWVAGASSGKLATSPDGVTWTLRTSTFSTAHIYAVTYGNGLYVAVGSSGKIATSPDGITWTARSSGKTDQFNAVTYGNGLFVVGGYSGAMVTSPDGIAWTSRTSGFGANVIWGLAYGAGKYVAVGSIGTLTYSADAITWTAGTHNFSGNTIYGVLYTNEFVIFGMGSPATGHIGVSSDGVTFGQGCIPGLGTVNCATNNGSLAVVGDASGRILTFNGLSNWLIRQMTGLSNINGAFTGGEFVLVGNSGKIVTSPGGTSWTARSSGTAQHLYAVAFGNAVYVAVGASGTVVTSLDRLTWTVQAQIFSGNQVNDVTFGNGQFVAVGSAGNVATSPDGVTWTLRSQPLGSVDFKSVTYGNGMYVALGDTASVIISRDGVSWTKLYAGFDTLSTTVAVRFVNGLFLITGNNHFATSRNGRTWTIHAYNGIPNTGKGIAFYAGKIFLGGQGGSGSFLSQLHDTVTMFSVPERFDPESKNYIYTGVLA